jgi:hypothetical protein
MSTYKSKHQISTVTMTFLCMVLCRKRVEVLSDSGNYAVALESSVFLDSCCQLQEG